MKVLTATAATQGARPTDFHHCIEGELVWIGPICAVDRTDPDGGCGCGRSFAGLASHQATTTAMVRDIAALSHASYADALRTGLAALRWFTTAVESLAADLLRLVDSWPVGTVAERRLATVAVRG